MEISSPSSSLLKLRCSVVLLCLRFIAFASHDPREDFLQCLSLDSANASSISKVIYTPINSTYIYIGLRPFRTKLEIPNTLYPTEPLAIITPVDVSRVQATQSTARESMASGSECGAGAMTLRANHTSPIYSLLSSV